MLLATGAAAGLLVAALGVFRTGVDAPPLGEDAIARVNGRIIRRAEFEAALEMLARDKRNALSDADRAHVLERLIDEELLVQRGVDVGLLESDRTVRKSIATAVIDSIVEESRSAEVTDAELRAFYEENLPYFERADALRIRQVLFRDGSERGDPSVRAEQAAAAIAGGVPVLEAARLFGDPPVHPLPDVPLAPKALREYLGPSATRAVQSMEPGEISSPLPSPYGRQILELVERRRSDAPPFEEIRDQVEGAHRQHAAGEALRHYVERLRGEARIDRAPEAPR